MMLSWRNIAIIIVILLVLFWYIYNRQSSKPTKQKRNKQKKSTKSTTKPKKTKSPNRQKKAKKEEESEDNEEENEESAVADDAEELYNLVHEGLCRGIQQEEFDELVGDLADSYTFIELKQLYNVHSQKGLDPNKSITVDHYVKILENESESE